MSSNAAFTHRVAENYEKYMGPMYFVPYAKDMASRLTGDIKSVLEVACGTGQVTRLLRKKLPNAKITATDLNEGMIEVAKKITNEDDNIEWKPANAEELPFDDNSFDSVICQFGLMFVPDKQKAVNEAYRVLKPGGRFIFNTWDKLEKNLPSQISMEVMLETFKENPPDFFNVPYSMYDPGEMESLLITAGFENITIESVHLKGFSESAENTARGLTEGTPAYMAISERDISLLPEIQKKVTEKVKAHYGQSSFEVELEAWVCEGVKS